MNGREYIICLLLVMAVSAWLYQCGPQPPTPSRVEVVHDTVYEVVHRPPMIVRGPATRIVRRDTVHDTTYIERAAPCAPYVAVLDTIVSRDTLTVEYKHPEASFSVMLRQRPDSIVKVFTTVTNTVHQGPDIWAQIGTHAATMLVGYGVGRLAR